MNQSLKLFVICNLVTKTHIGIIIKIFFQQDSKLPKQYQPWTY